MCGIVGYVPVERNAPAEKNSLGAELLTALRRLEYRGYDSAGIAVADASEIVVQKGIGGIVSVQQQCEFQTMDGIAGIGHTRWATHGAVTQSNAHPHLSCDKRIAVVHNGIVRQHAAWRQTLKQRRHCFQSETDSEVIAHLCEEWLANGATMEEVVVWCLHTLEGEYACALLDRESGAIGVAKRDSPLAVGYGTAGWYIGSDINAFSHVTQQAVFLDDGECAVIRPTGIVYYNSDGATIDKTPQTFEWGALETIAGDFTHYMEKEIYEIPLTVRRLQQSLETDQYATLAQLQETITANMDVVLTGSGTSYHAALYGAYVLHAAGYAAQAVVASEFQDCVQPDADTLVIGVSQSGETMDVLQAMKYAKQQGSTLAAIVNVPHSSIQRLSDIQLETRAGQEYCVVATKTFITPCVLFLVLGRRLGIDCDLSQLAETFQSVLDINADGIATTLSKRVFQEQDVYVIGRGVCYPAALEIALKLKETSYIHAEGMMGGELKHGSLALIEPGTVVIGLSSGEDDAIAPNIAEVAARGANVIRAEPRTQALYLPNNLYVVPLASAIVGFLLTYHTAHRKELPIDKPRNLAKSVTVV